MTRKELVKKVKSVLIFDRVVAKSDGTFEVRDGYFYRMGRSAEMLAAQVETHLAAVELDATILAAEDHWNAWPKSSFFLVRFTVQEPEIMTRGGFLPLSETEVR